MIKSSKQYVIDHINPLEDISSDIDDFFDYLNKEYINVKKYWIFEKKLVGISKTNNPLESYNR